MEEDDHADRWVISYADFVTLLFAFFTTLYAISHVDSGKLAMFAGSMKSAFNAGAQGPGRMIEGIRPISPDVIEIEQEVRRTLANAGALNEVGLRKDERGVTISISDNLLFEPGQYRLKKSAVAVLEKIATVLRGLPLRVNVEGHTDNVPVTGPNAKYSSNWELSTARATGVLTYFVRDCGLSPGRFSASGYAEYKPVAPNDTPEGRTMNRRVDVVILSARS